MQINCCSHLGDIRVQNIPKIKCLSRNYAYKTFLCKGGLFPAHEMSHCCYPQCNDIQNKSHEFRSCLPEVRCAKLSSPRSAKYCNYIVETYCYLQQKKALDWYLQTHLLFFCFADAEVAFFSELKRSYRFAGNAAQIVQRWLIYCVKCTEKHVCVIHVSRERKCMRSNVARPIKGRGKLQINPQNRTIARYKVVHRLWRKKERIRSAQRLQICIPLALALIFHFR